MDDLIRQSRKLLQNPYAHLDGDGGFDAIIPERYLNVHEARRLLENQYAYLDAEGGYSEWPYYEKGTPNGRMVVDTDELLGNLSKDHRFTNQEIEAIVRRLQAQLWRRRHELWPARKEVGPLEILDPSVALESIGFALELHETLGQSSGNGELFEIAGVLDTSDSRVQISRRFSPEIRRFTTAHELAHAVLHTGSGLHRDRALDGSPANRSRDAKESEADIFAAYFLLPEKQVRRVFEEIFLTPRFVLTDETAFALAEDLAVLRRRCRTLRDLTRMLAAAKKYNLEAVNSMTERFGVSTEAMAIRLEELGLAHF
jgi:Zn-dependent peptidase ImmA (M78 family)